MSPSRVQISEGPDFGLDSVVEDSQYIENMNNRG